ncbi:class I SAM-dependent methyltransferase [Roseomonas stagni]|uniref:Class I SAM-dependent methyltransferase n=1 Tax=Falsiroseomonas algicola TaxID=2716930 RepID=A0A6M1LDX9_9PROT|nr:class I SAM-dependent methyltransferase [Falsiroseomonas algicola]NGM18488.1 class I SAM-dependent methyltransferase [Falsiroseomonas algicola]
MWRGRTPISPGSTPTAPCSASPSTTRPPPSRPWATCSPCSARCRRCRARRCWKLGCGTGWLVRILARLGLQAHGCDVSAVVLRLAEDFARRHEPDLLRRLTWLHSPDGVAIPLADGSMDRAVMYGAFHHVHDQAGTLRELGRVLGSTGRAVFIEPGPEHSRTAASQAEMRNHGVIENDVRLEEIWPLAQAAGFTEMEVAVGTARVPFVPVAEFLPLAARRRARQPLDSNDLAPVIGQVNPFLDNTRHFVLIKSSGRADTREARNAALRSAAPLGAILIREVRAQEPGLAVQVELRNTGALEWRASGGDRGAVNLGVQLMQGDTLVKRDFRRVPVAKAPTEPGGHRVLDFTLPAPGPGLRYRLDLVAEHVCWFEAPADLPG